MVEALFYPVRRLVVLLLVMVACSQQASGSVVIRGIKWDAAPRQLRCSVYSQLPIQIDKKDLIAEKGLFYIDLYNVELAQPLAKETYEINNEFLRAVNFRMLPEYKVLRLHFWPQSGVKWSVKSQQNPSQVVIELSLPSDAAPVAKTPAPKQPASPVPTVAPKGKETPRPSLELEKNSTRSIKSISSNIIQQVSMRSQRPSSPSKSGSTVKEKVVVIDPGHGGTRGADGVIKRNGKYVNEKDINFEIARRLAGLIQKAGNMRYVMTRSTDAHVSLRDRVSFAESISGDCIFISIHNNDTDNASARGPEFYFLDESRVGKSEALRELERLENDEDLKEDFDANSALRNIFLSLEQGKLRERKAQGKRFCELMSFFFNQNSYFKAHNRGVKGASFMVLRNMQMPAALVEVGFMSNPEECRKLMEPNFQYNAAVGIFNAINAYFEIQDPTFDAKKYDFK